MGSPIATLQQVKDRAPVNADQTTDLVLTELIQAATDAIEGRCNRTFAQAAMSKTFDGDRHPVGRYRDLLYLPSPPVATSPMPTVTENGVALTVTAAYDGSGAYDVQLDPDDGILYRSALYVSTATGTRGWAEGRRNIVAGWTGGYATLPSDIVSACVELTWLLWRTTKAAGWDSYNAGDASAQAIRELSAEAKSTIDRYTLWGRP